MSADENEITRLQGEAKEQLGEATDDQQLRDEGRADQAQAQTKDAVESAGDKAKDAVEKAGDTAKKAVDSVRDKLGR